MNEIFTFSDVNVVAINAPVTDAVYMVLKLVVSLNGNAVF